MNFTPTLSPQESGMLMHGMCGSLTKNATCRLTCLNALSSYSSSIWKNKKDKEFWNCWRNYVTSDKLWNFIFPMAGQFSLSLWLSLWLSHFLSLFYRSSCRSLSHLLGNMSPECHQASHQDYNDLSSETSFIRDVLILVSLHSKSPMT